MKYLVISLSHVPEGKTDLVSDCYNIFKSVYEPILASASEKLQPDFFYKAKLLSVLVNDAYKPVAFALHNNMQTVLPDVTQLSYFEPSPAEFLKTIEAGKEHVLTIEWVTVNPAERGKFTKIQPVDLLMGLTFQLALHSPYTGVMGYSRTDLKADRVGGKFGPKPVAEISLHNIPCKVMFAKTSELHDHPLKKVQAIITELWETRETYLMFLIDKPKPTVTPIRRIA